MSDPITRLNAALEGRYRIERELGEGGMATVYLADDLKHERKVTLKVLKPELAAVVGAERFLAEIKTTANLQHPHILPLFDSDEADSFLFYVMPYVEGESLKEKLDREHQLSVDEALRITTDIAEALQAAHQQGVIPSGMHSRLVTVRSPSRRASLGHLQRRVQHRSTRQVQNSPPRRRMTWLSPPQPLQARRFTLG